MPAHSSPSSVLTEQLTVFACVRFVCASCSAAGMQCLRLSFIDEGPFSGLCEQLTCLHVDDFSGV
jgi:hypothetical protein